MASPTPRQKALLEYLGLPVPSSNFEASQTLSEVAENPAYSARMESWTSDRFSLHPDLYQWGTPARQKDRAEDMRALNNEERGAGAPLKVITYQQAQRAVEWLDANQPRWSENLYDEFGVPSIALLYDCFIPVVAMLMPETVKRGYEGSISNQIKYDINDAPSSTAKMGPHVIVIHDGTRRRVWQWTGVGLILAGLLIFVPISAVGVVILIVGLMMDYQMHCSCSVCGNSVNSTSKICPICQAELNGHAVAPGS